MVTRRSVLHRRITLPVIFVFALTPRARYAIMLVIEQPFLLMHPLEASKGGLCDD